MSGEISLCSQTYLGGFTLLFKDKKQVTTEAITTITLIFRTAGEFSVHSCGLILLFPCRKFFQFSTFQWESGQ